MEEDTITDTTVKPRMHNADSKEFHKNQREIFNI
jgi:hypothetical protein